MKSAIYQGWDSSTSLGVEVQQEPLLGAPESGQALETTALLVCTSLGLGKRPTSGIWQL